jgi:hypothetical protein
MIVALILVGIHTRIRFGEALYVRAQRGPGGVGDHADADLTGFTAYSTDERRSIIGIRPATAALVGAPPRRV